MECRSQGPSGIVVAKLTLHGGTTSRTRRRRGIDTLTAVEFGLPIGVEATLCKRGNGGIMWHEYYELGVSMTRFRGCLNGHKGRRVRVRGLREPGNCRPGPLTGRGSRLIRPIPTKSDLSGWITCEPRKGAKSAEVLVVVRLLRFFAATRLRWSASGIRPNPTKSDL